MEFRRVIFRSEAAESNLDLLVSNLSEKISNEKRLLNVETQVQSTQTANFDLNETIFDRIGSFLNVRDETSFTVAANEGRNLPFNNVPLASYANQRSEAHTSELKSLMRTTYAVFSLKKKNTK